MPQEQHPEHDVQPQLDVKSPEVPGLRGAGTLYEVLGAAAAEREIVESEQLRSSNLAMAMRRYGSTRDRYSMRYQPRTTQLPPKLPRPTNS